MAHMGEGAWMGDSAVSLTSAVESDFSPAWSPDGQAIAFLRALPANRVQYVIKPYPDGTNTSWQQQRVACAGALPARSLVSRWQAPHHLSINAGSDCGLVALSIATAAAIKLNSLRPGRVTLRPPFHQTGERSLSSGARQTRISHYTPLPSQGIRSQLDSPGRSPLKWISSKPACLGPCFRRARVCARKLLIRFRALPSRGGARTKPTPSSARDQPRRGHQFPGTAASSSSREHRRVLRSGELNSQPTR